MLLEFELAFYDVAVEYINHSIPCDMIEIKSVEFIVWTGDINFILSKIHWHKMKLQHSECVFQFSKELLHCLATQQRIKTYPTRPTVGRGW